jgi:hypothetical protein
MLLVVIKNVLLAHLQNVFNAQLALSHITTNVRRNNQKLLTKVKTDTIIVKKVVQYAQMERIVPNVQMDNFYTKEIAYQNVLQRLFKLEVKMFVEILVKLDLNYSAIQ